MLCMTDSDNAAMFNSYGRPVKPSTAATTWSNPGAGTYRHVVVDLGSIIGSYSVAYFWQTFSDGKTTAVTLGFSDYYLDPADAGWITSYSASLTDDQYVPAATIAFPARSERYVRVGAENSGIYLSPSYIELFGFTLFNLPQ